MTTKIGLISDPHASPEPLAEALALFVREGVEVILCAGDIGGYGEHLEETVALLKRYGVRSIRGNHEQWALQQEEFPASAACRDYFLSLPTRLSLTIEGVTLDMVHAEPPDRMTKGLRLFDQYGEVIPEVLAEWHDRLDGFGHDVLILGHTHQVYDIRLGDTLVINPGSCTFNHSCAILQLPQQEVRWFALSGMGIEKTWNWGTNQLR